MFERVLPSTLLGKMFGYCTQLSLALTLGLVLSAPLLAQSRSSAKAGREIPSALGWHQIPNTQLAPKCPTDPAVQGVEGCSGVLADWSGGLADTKRNRLVIWGGGHNGYYGNEVYALDLIANPITIARVNDPSTPDFDCNESYPDGQPSARHTYNGMQYLPAQDLYFTYGSGLVPCGNFSNSIWMLNPVSMTWAQHLPTIHPNPGQNGSVPQTAYDPFSRTIYEVETNTGIFWKYDPVADTWTRLADVAACGLLNMTAAIDPGRRLYFCVGNGGFYEITLKAPHKVARPVGRGCAGLLSAAGPGFDYDPVQKRMVGWAGGDVVYVYDPDTDTCTAQTYSGGPGAPQANGTYGRFRYFPSLGIFALVNDLRENAFVLRLTPQATALDAPR